MSRADATMVDGLAVAHSKGEDVSSLVVHIPAMVDVAAIRNRTGLTQAAFASRIGVSLGTLRHWEQHRRKPDGPARVLLAMLERDPKVVERTLVTGSRSAR